MALGKILAIDDEKNIRHLLRNELALEGFEVVTAKSGEEGLKLVEKENFDLVLLDIRLPRLDGIEVLRILRQKRADLKVIMITAYGDIRTAVDSMKLGACEYITKPFKLGELVALIKQHLQTPAIRLPAGDAAESGSGPEPEFIFCPSRVMQEVYALISKVAPSDKTVLILGETGAGKDIIARQIHYQSLRREGPFVVVDCGILNQNLAESELYGHTKGAFSGAVDRKLGLVEKAHGGTLFLDEIGNIDLDLQKKFLRFLETKKFRRLGETKEMQVDVRLILATNLDLQEAVQRGTLRKDLFFRMDMIHIEVPPLRKRPEDIVPLAEYFLKVDRIPNGPTRLSAEVKGILTEYAWPGNVRELRSVINKAMIFASGDTITARDLPSELRRTPAPGPQKTLEDVEKDYIMTVLAQTGGNQSEAAKILGINRKTLYKKIHKYQFFT